MANVDEKNAPVPGDEVGEGEGEGERKKNADESPGLPRDAGRQPDMEDAEETFDLPEPKRQADYDAERDPDEKRMADSAFDDLEIEVDESELESELGGPSPIRKI